VKRGKKIVLMVETRKLLMPVEWRDPVSDHVHHVPGSQNRKKCNGLNKRTRAANRMGP
jgi:hypothetical protein